MAAAEPRQLTVPAPRAVQGAKQSGLRGMLEWVLLVVGAVVVALLVKTFLLQAFFIPSGSMRPTLVEGDRVLVNKLSYRFGDPSRGDIVVFERPPNDQSSSNQDIKDLIKRVIGLPGETISCSSTGVMLIDGRPLDEPYIPEGVASDCRGQQWTVGVDEIFVMGDNRNDSTDSRVFGAVKQSSIVGRAFIRIWPFKEFGTL
jgi:signal peptidase I